jgi:hypothetical protein
VEDVNYNRACETDGAWTGEMFESWLAEAWQRLLLDDNPILTLYRQK